MSAPAEESIALLDRLRATLTAQKPGKQGKQQDVSVAFQDVLGLLANYNQSAEVALAALSVLEDTMAAVPQASTILRLEGGLKLLPRLFRSLAADGAVLAVCSRVLCRCVASSAANQAALAKERGFGQALLSSLAAHCRDATAVPPLMELLVVLSRTARGAQALGGEAMVLVARDLLLNFMGNWGVFGLVIKALKLQSKHDTVAACLMRVAGGEVSRMLMAVARLLARLPGQHKLLKRTSRTLWLLHRGLLQPLPDLEPLVPLPPRDAPHLSLAAAPEATDAARLMELVPEEFAAEFNTPPPQPQQPGTSPSSAITLLPPPQQQVADDLSRGSGGASGGSGGLAAGVGGGVPGRTAHMARVPRPPALRPPTAAELSTAAQLGGQQQEPFHSCGAGLEIDMMMHDLRRVVHPEAVLGRVVYDSTAPAGCVSAGLSGLSLSAQRPGGTMGPAGPAQGQGQSAVDRSGVAYGQLLLDAAANSGETLGPVPAPLLHTAMSAVSTRASAAKPGAAAPRSTSSPVPPLSFESRFESGNLRAAVQVYDNEYDLFLAPDLNDRSEGGNLCQWFFFCVTDVQAGVPYRFNLVNFRKKQSLFSSGKQPLVCLAQRPTSTSSSSSSSSAPSRTATTTTPPAPPPHPSALPAAAGSSSSSSSPGGAVGSGSALVSGGAADNWVRAGGCVAYYPSPFRGRRLPTASVEQARRPASKKAPVKRGGGAGAGRTGPPAAGQLQSSSQPGAPTGPGGSSGTAGSRDRGDKDSRGEKDSSRDSRDSSSATKDLLGEGQAPSTGPGLWCATFTLVFPQPGVYYVASCYPYTYSDLQAHLDTVATRLAVSDTTRRCIQEAEGASSSPSPPLDPQQLLPLPLQPAPCVLAGLLVRSVLCYTLAGQTAELITVTDFSAPPEVVAAREVVVLTARVHPGETCASWIMQGALDFLTSQDPAACMLRSSFVFKLVPMLNPDGVVNGSYRCSLAGQDLNRTWEKPLKAVQPTVYHTKRLMQALAAGGVGRLALYIDIHGHSNKEDVFFYGCEPNLSGYPNGPAAPSAPQPPTQQQQARQNTPGRTGSGTNSGNTTGTTPDADATSGSGPAASSVNARMAARMRVRMLPYLLSRLSSTWSYQKCNFRIRKAKLGAARVVVHRELGCAGAYTLEASLGGRAASRMHFSVADYLSMGMELCRGIAELAEVDDAALLDEMAGGSVTLTPYVGAYTV